MLGLGAAWPLKILPWAPSLLPSGGPLPALGLASCPDGGGLSSVVVPLQILLARLARPLRQGTASSCGNGVCASAFSADAGGLSVSSCRPGCMQICFAWCVHSLAASPQTPLHDRACSFMTPVLGSSRLQLGRGWECFLPSLRGGALRRLRLGRTFV